MNQTTIIWYGRPWILNVIWPIIFILAFLGLCTVSIIVTIVFVLITG